MKKLLYTIAAAGMLSLGGCNDYLDVNTDPNSPSFENLNPSLVFPAAEMAFANNYGDYLRITGGYFAQYYSQFFGTSNYLDYSQFTQSAVRSSSTYQNLASKVLQNIQVVKTMAQEKEEWGTNLAATVIRAAAYQAMVDCYGEIPYSESLNTEVIMPKYDNGKDIYAGIIKELDDALAKVNGTEDVCTNFLLPGAPASEWVKVANALKLRILMRESDVVDVKAQLTALVNENNFPATDVMWTRCWGNSSGQANPFYQEEFADYFGSTQVNVALNLALLATMEDAADQRLQAWWNPNTESGSYKGAVSGTNFNTAADKFNANFFCRPNMAYDSPVYFITLSEIEFFLAEYQAKYGSPSLAAAHYDAAVAASFATAGIPGQETTVLAAWPWDASNWKKCIGIQKWVSLSGTNPFEGYCELRRLGYPAFGNVSGAQIFNVITKDYKPELLVPGTLYTPIDVNSSVGPNKLLQRWPYPEASANRNENSPKFPGETTPIFWAN